MPVNPSSNRFPYDAATAFRAYTDAAIVADGGTAALPVDAGTSYWDTSIMTNREFAVVIDVTALLAASHTYKLSMEFDADGNFASGAVASELQITPGAVGTYVILVPRERIPADARFMRIAVDVTGATPTITFAAWASPIV